ncbi:D-alanine--D-alanine ligase family protein [Kitasatospora sp. McL0602]|uniref:D-alanine--D-alanine ligase family protein n=1 Tax=Kitasatospora sp. McL0602 TaxID=3439530 RepID=UPI003F8952E0
MSSSRSIAVITGGRSGEPDRSLLSGNAVHQSLPRQGLLQVALDPTDAEFTEHVRAVDVAFLAIAGQWSEDGKLQGMLDSLGFPYTGCVVMASAIGMYKPTAKSVVQAAGVNDLPHVLLRASEDLETLPTTAEFHDYAAKRDPNGHEYRYPAGLPPLVAAAVQRAALDAHRALGCHSHSHSDFTVTAGGEVLWLEVNTLPGLSPHGNLATMAGAAGISYDQLIALILDAAHHDGYRP